MDGEWARLQATLRAIERGERLASIDDLLIRRILHQPPPKAPGLAAFTAHTPAVHGNNNNDDVTVAAATADVQGSEAYRVLLALRKQKKARKPAPEEPSASVRPVSPIKSPVNAASPTKRDQDRAATDYDDQRRRLVQASAEDELVVKQYRQEMNESLAETQRKLQQSQHQVVVASEEMQALLTASQSILSSQFLFEKNLTQFCQERSLEVIQRVMQRFQHRFYKLYYRKWVEITRFLRREEQKRAVATIIRVFRGHRARKLRRVLQKEAAKLKVQAKQVLELRISYRLHQAFKIQRIWQRYQWKKRERYRIKRKQAACYLQQQWRDRKLRQNALISTLLNIKSILAAIRIQRIVRGFLTRTTITRHKKELRRQAMAMTMLTRNTNRQAMLQWQLERRGAGFVICQAMYPMLIRQKFRKLASLLKKQRAASQIVGFMWLWWSSRDSHKQRQKQLAAERLRSVLLQQQKPIFTAAVLIQKHIKRWWQQQNYKCQQTRRRKLARLTRIRDKVERRSRPSVKKPQGVAAIAKGGLVDIMKQTKKKGGPQSVSPEELQNAAALRIQRAYLHHRHHVHFRLKQWRRQAVDVEIRVQRRREAAIRIQKRVRGINARTRVRILKAQRLVCRFVRQWKWKRANQRATAAARIVRWLKHNRAQRLVALWRLEKQRRLEMAVRIQHWLRWGFFYRKTVAKLLKVHRKRHEASVFATQSLVICVQHITDAFVLQSSLATAYDDGIKSYVKGSFHLPPTARKPPARARFPILPMLFLAVSGLKDSSKWPSVDVKELLATKMERSKVIALFKAANKHGVATTSPKRRHKNNAAEMFSMTDVDLVMAKAAGASKRALVFAEFVETLQSLADMKLQHVTVWWNKYDGPEARVLALLWQYLFAVPELKGFVDALTVYAAQVVDAQARVLQRLLMRKRDAARGHILKLQLLQQREIELKRRALIKVQACVRRRLARKIFKSRICEQYDKYVDSAWGLPYWMNRKTGYSTWLKPWALQDEDVATEAVPFPPEDKRVVVQCEGKSGCETCSDWYCDVCDEFFCDECVETFHKVKEGSVHELERLRKCGLCQFQVATRECTSCVEAQRKLTKKAKAKPQDETTAKDDSEREALFCDVCYAFAHRRGALQVHKSVPLVELCDDCHADDETLLDHEKIPKTAAPPKYPRAVQWVCETDKKRVCGACAVLKHPVEACGELRRVQVVTLQMKTRAERRAKEQADRERFDTELIKLRELQVKQERCAKKIQRFWMNCMPLMRARRVARALREQKDATWKQIQEDTATQKKLPYRLKNALGMAPPLPSDSVAARKLREMNVLQRRQMGIRARMFGLLLPEYMQLGVPLPGIARVRKGNKYLQCSEDLRGWILNRQTLRLKKLPTKADRDRARKIKFRHHEPPLEDKAWLHDREMWMRNPNDSVLVDVDAKLRITEHTVPLVSEVGVMEAKPPPGGKQTGHTVIKKPALATKEEEGDAEGEEEEYAMFLVEFSMDPARVVWVSHSLAERFSVWRKQKLREYRERRALQQKTTASGSDDTETKALNGDLPLTVDATVSASETAPVLDTETAQTEAANEAAWAEYYAANGYDYTNYYAENAWSRPSPAASASSPYSPSGYEAVGYSLSTPTTGAANGYYAAASPLVDSSNYFYAKDGNAAAWQAYYQSYPEAQHTYDTQYQYPDTQAAAYDAHRYTDSGYYTQTAQQQWPTTTAVASSSQSAWDASYDNYGYDQTGYSYDQNYVATTAITTTAAGALAYPWEEVFDPSSQQAYYFNHETQQTSWTHPYPYS